MSPTPSWSWTTGAIEQVGSPRDLYEHPANEFVMSFVGPVTRVEHELRPAPRPRHPAPSPTEARSEAMIERVVYLGFEVRVELVLPDGTRVWAQVPRDQAERQELASGQIIYMRPRCDPRSKPRARTRRGSRSRSRVRPHRNRRRRPRGPDPGSGARLGGAVGCAGACGDHRCASGSPECDPARATPPVAAKARTRSGSSRLTRSARLVSSTNPRNAARTAIQTSVSPSAPRCSWCSRAGRRGRWRGGLDGPDDVREV